MNNDVGIRVKIITLIIMISLIVNIGQTLYVPVYANQAFEKALNDEGFPESYKQFLRELNNKYPQWIFKAQHTGLDWNEAIEAQSELGKNLVHSTSISSWKSIQAGAYDWNTNTWVGFDSASWVAASSEIIMYYMDPRNSLDEATIFQFLKHSYDEKTQNSDGLWNIVEGTFLAGRVANAGNSGEISYSDIIIEAASKSGVSPYVIAAMILQEQGNNGIGSCISGTYAGYEGYYNYFNIGAFPSNGMNAIQRGLWYASQGSTYERPWNNRSSSIIGGAIYYGQNYVNVGQDTFYLKKFNVQGSNLHRHQYMTNVGGSYSEAIKLSEAYSKLKSSPLEFKIPVFNNMPANASVRPTGTGSPNNLLKEITVNGYSLTPSFNKDISEYNLIVPGTVSSIDIKATAIDNNAVVKGVGNISLHPGTNTININVTASNGTEKKYVIYAARGTGTSTGPVGPGQTGPTGPEQNIEMQYKISSDNILTGVEPNTTVTDFISKIKLSSGSVKVFKTNGTEVLDRVGTSDVVKIYNNSNTVRNEYKICIIGDINGDGSVNALDLLRVQRHLLGAAALESDYSIAADVNVDGNINALDLLRIQKDILGIEKIVQ